MARVRGVFGLSAGEAEEQRDFMARALTLAAKARGRTSPNPLVGAVMVKDGRIIGEGYHRGAGEPHAEIEALREAGQEARGATLYINLEPCCHWGCTAPCTKALIQAGLGEVYMAMLDPNPLVNGQGRAELESAGVRTHVGLMAGEAERLNQAFANYITTGLPFVTAKYAMTLDGKIASHTGDARWVTGEQARRRVHELRDESDAVMVGVDTVLADDPLLTTRLNKDDLRHPLRVVVDSRGRMPLSARILREDTPGQTLIATTDQIPPERVVKLQEQSAEVLQLPSRNGRVALFPLMEALARREMMTVLVEGGGTLLAGLLEQGLVDRVLAFIAPKVLGGKDAPSPVEGMGRERMAEATELTDIEVERIGDDVLISGYLED
jgi:diaminohydroxyphosphoribosylaminopyrimidine deaminase/5-amino-6-(5-phosphoribosylamino)uracil reductase